MPAAVRQSIQRSNGAIVHLWRRPNFLRVGRDECESVPKGCWYRAENRSREIGRAARRRIANEIKVIRQALYGFKYLSQAFLGMGSVRLRCRGRLRRRRLKCLQDDIFGILKPTALKTLINEGLNFGFGDLNSHRRGLPLISLCMALDLRPVI